MTIEDKARPALRAALAALAPAMKLKRSAVDQLTNDLIGGVGQDSFGSFWISGSGRDVANHIETVIRPARPELFETAPSPSTVGLTAPDRNPDRLTATERRARAADRLSRANGDAGPKL